MSDPAVIVVKKARLSYSAIFNPRKGQGDDGEDKDPRYSASLILDKESQAEMIKSFRRVVRDVAAAKWPNKTVTVKGSGEVICKADGDGKIVILGSCLKDGSDKADKDGYGDHVMFISASRGIKDSKGTELPPLPVIDPKGNKPIDPRSGKVYDGCFVHASVRVWAQDNTYGKRINCELRAVAFAEDGTPFGNGPVDTKKEFGDIVIDDEFGDVNEPAKKPAPKKAAPVTSDIDDLDDL